LLVEYNFEIKYRTEKINSINKLLKQSDYKNKTDNKICLFIFQNKLKNITIATIEITSVLIRNTTKTILILICINIVLCV